MDMLLRTAEIAGAVAGLVAAAGLLVSFFQWAHRITDGSKCQLRSDMLKHIGRWAGTRLLRRYTRK